MRKVKISNLSHQLRKQVRQLMKEGHTFKSFPKEVQQGILKEYEDGDDYPGTQSWKRPDRDMGMPIDEIYDCLADEKNMLNSNDFDEDPESAISLFLQKLEYPHDFIMKQGPVKDDGYGPHLHREGAYGLHLVHEIPKEVFIQEFDSFKNSFRLSSKFVAFCQRAPFTPWYEAYCEGGEPDKPKDIRVQESIKMRNKKLAGLLREDTEK